MLSLTSRLLHNGSFTQSLKSTCSVGPSVNQSTHHVINPSFQVAALSSRSRLAEKKRHARELQQKLEEKALAKKAAMQGQKLQTVVAASSKQQTNNKRSNTQSNNQMMKQSPNAVTKQGNSPVMKQIAPLQTIMKAADRLIIPTVDSRIVFRLPSEPNFAPTHIRNFVSAQRKPLDLGDEIIAWADDPVADDWLGLTPGETKSHKLQQRAVNALAHDNETTRPSRATR